MNIVATTGLGLGLTMQMCGSSSSGTSSTPTSTGYSCRDYQIILDVEVLVAEECTTDADCDQVLDGTGCGCPTDDLIVSGDYDSDYFYEMLDEAVAESCSIDFATTCECDPTAKPVCYAGTCEWAY